MRSQCMNSGIRPKFKFNKVPNEFVSLRVLTLVAEVMNSYSKSATIPRGARKFYKLVTADNSQIIDGRIVSAAVSNTSKKGPSGGSLEAEKITKGNSDFAADKFLTSTLPRHTSNSSSTKVTLRKKCKPQHRNQQMNDNLKSIIRTSRFCSVPKESVGENSLLSAFKKAKAKPKLRMSFVSKSAFEESEDKRLLHSRSIPKGWIPGVDFSRDMEVFFFTVNDANLF